MYSHGRKVGERMKPGWNNLGVVETIFEDENEELDSLSSSPLSFPLFSPPSPLQSGIDAWTSDTGTKPDVTIYVRGICFHLHKDPLISKSSYLKRQLIRVSEYTLSPPLKVAADIFKLVADFCYSNHAVITPSNVAALRTAVELLEMDGDGVESLREITEAYLCNVLLHNKEFINTVFRTSLALLPEAEQTASIVSRCLEALLSSVDDGDGDGAVSCADGLKGVTPEDFGVIADSMPRRFTRSHDLLYRVVDLYFLVYNGKIMSEEQRTQITRCIDCSILSAPLLMHAVQNPRMPLRFVVQAMLIEQLNTHRSIFSVLNTTTNPATITSPRAHHDFPSESPATLGAILERDAALRQVAQLRSAIDTTSSKIQTLEKELSSMKRLLGEKRKEKQAETGDILLLEDGRRSASCRFSSSNGISTNHKVERGERGSVSSSMVRLFGGANTNTNDLPKHRIVGSSSSSSWCLQSDYQSPKANEKRNFGQRLIRGLRNAFGVSNKLKKNEKLIGEDHKEVGFDKEEITFDSFAMSNSLPHHRSHSVS